ncbi:MAG: hypothetical protein V1773_17580 [bacterium]
MKKYTYPIFAQIIYRYANILISFILLTQIFIFVLAPNKNWYYMFFVLINLVFVFSINWYYYKNYKYFPYKIEIDNEKIICSNFFINNRKEEIKLSEIELITGGIFSNKPSIAIFIHYAGKKIGINRQLKNYNEFLTTVLSNLNNTVYTVLLNQLKENNLRNRTNTSEGTSK